MSKITLFLLWFSGSLWAQIINTAPYILTVDELKLWTQDGPTASTDLIAYAPLAQRFQNTATQFNPALNQNMQLAYLPDGMNNFGNYFLEQDQFNLYNFTHWAYIDKLVWFGGTSSQSVQLPSSPWTNAAHRNGVKVFANVFFAPTAFGGSNATLQNFLEQDGAGNFVAIPKMIAIMQYYRFDGWFINQETATTAAVAALMHDFVRDLTTAAEALGKEVMWYDAMRLTGAVGWQNRLNLNNSPFVQDDADGDGTFETRVGSSIFINFFWASNSFPTMSRTRAQTIGRSEFDVFTGADIWPGRNQGDFLTNGNTFMGYLHENATTPFTSLGLFAPNGIYNNSLYTNFNNDPNDYASFYEAENKMFGGADGNPATVDANGWKGFSNWIPETGVVYDELFATNFCTGHGTKKFNGGSVAGNQSWHDMNQQEPLPTWQWAFTPGGVLTAAWDFDDAWEGGNSIKITGDLQANTPVDLMLYKTKIAVPPLSGFSTMGLTFKCALPDPKMKFILVFADAPDQKYAFNLTNEIFQNGWAMDGFDLSEHAGREVAMIGLRFESDMDVPDYVMNIGRLVNLTVLNVNDHFLEDQLVTVSYPDHRGVVFSINWPGAKQIQYAIFNMHGQKVKSDEIQMGDFTEYAFDAHGLPAGTYIGRFDDGNGVVVSRKFVVR